MVSFQGIRVNLGPEKEWEPQVRTLYVLKIFKKAKSVSKKIFSQFLVFSKIPPNFKCGPKTPFSDKIYNDESCLEFFSDTILPSELDHIDFQSIKKQLFFKKLSYVKQTYYSASGIPKMLLFGI